MSEKSYHVGTHWVGYHDHKTPSKTRNLLLWAAAIWESLSWWERIHPPASLGSPIIPSQCNHQLTHGVYGLVRSTETGMMRIFLIERCFSGRFPLFSGPPISRKSNGTRPIPSVTWLTDPLIRDKIGPVVGDLYFLTTSFSPFCFR